MRETWRGLWAVVSMRLKISLSHRADLAFHVLTHSILTLVGLVVVATIFHHVPEVRGWTVYEVLLCWGFAEACLGLYRVFFPGLIDLNRQYILGGELDRVLLRPVDPYVQIMADHLQPEAFALVMLGLGVIGWGAVGIGEPWTLVQLGMLPVFVVGGALIVGGVLTALASLGFWMQHQGTAVGIATQLSSFARYPTDFFPMWITALVTVIPFAFIGFVPATFYMTHTTWSNVAWLQPIVGLACMSGGYAFWRISLRRYASSGW